MPACGMVAFQVGRPNLRQRRGIYGIKKVQHGFSYRLDVVKIPAVQVEIVEGRQSDQCRRHTAVHADIEVAIT
jgi:hypothetical protein